MSFYTDVRDKTAKPLIVKYGQAVTLTTPGTDTFDPATGEGTAGTPVTDAGHGVRENKSVADKTGINGNTIEVRNAFLMHCVNIAEPVPGRDTLTVGGVAYPILSVIPVSPGGVDILYTVELKNG